MLPKRVAEDFLPSKTSRKGIFLLGWLMTVGVSVIYCLPDHPHFIQSQWHDAAHAALFCGMGLWFTRVAEHRWSLLPLALLAAVLEWAQWRLGGYAHVEYRDIASNELGVMVALALDLTLRYRAGLRRS